MLWTLAVVLLTHRHCSCCRATAHEIGSVKQAPEGTGDGLVPSWHWCGSWLLPRTLDVSSIYLHRGWCNRSPRGAIIERQESVTVNSIATGWFYASTLRLPDKNTTSNRPTTLFGSYTVMNWERMCHHVSRGKMMRRRSTWCSCRVEEGALLIANADARRVLGSGRGETVTQYAADGADGGHVTAAAHTVCQQLVPYLPGKDASILLLVAPNCIHNLPPVIHYI